MITHANDNSHGFQFLAIFVAVQQHLEVFMSGREGGGQGKVTYEKLLQGESCQVKTTTLEPSEALSCMVVSSEYSYAVLNLIPGPSYCLLLGPFHVMQNGWEH